MRRQRYTATVTEQASGIRKPLDILAYSQADAIVVAAANGYTVHTTPKLKRAVVAEQAAARTWSLDMPAIRAGFEAMSGRAIPDALRFIVAPTNVSREGQFLVERNGDLKIEVAGYLDPLRASQALWHELCHLKQYLEHIGDAAPGTVDAYAAHKRVWRAERLMRYGYENRPCEREARTWEVLADTDPLVRA